MAKQTVNLGVIPDGVGGDDVRTGFTKVNDNFTELYTLPTQAEAEGGSVSVVRGWSALRVRQAILGWWNSVTSSFGRSFVSGTADAGREALQVVSENPINLTSSVTPTQKVKFFRNGALGNPSMPSTSVYGGLLLPSSGAYESTIVATTANSAGGNLNRTRAYIGGFDSTSTPVRYSELFKSVKGVIPAFDITSVEQSEPMSMRFDTVWEGLAPYGSILQLGDSTVWARIGIGHTSVQNKVVVQGGTLGSSKWTAELYHTSNTTKNPDGTLKASSPVINLYTDHHDLRNEEQFGGTPTVARKSKGVYEITGTLGLRSEGWYLDTPNDRNGNKYFNVEWYQNITPDAVDGIVDEYRDDIVVTIETFERVWNKETGMFDNGAPIDINELQDRFVQLRFNEIKVEHEDITKQDAQ